jgi:hypothetical protein
MITAGGRARDNQKSKVYFWESVIALPDAANQPLTLKECARLVKRVYKLYDKAAPRIQDGRGTRNAYGSPWAINLPRWARTGRVVLHEAAHGLTKIYCPNKAAHGAEFVAIFAELLHIIYGVSLFYLEGEAIKHRVTMAAASYKPEHLKARTNAHTQRLR